MIEHPDKEFKASELPAVVNEKSIAQIKESVLNLNMVARILKKLRLELGSLRLDQNKLKFVLSPETGLPLAVGNEEVCGSDVDHDHVTNCSAKMPTSLSKSSCFSPTNVLPSTSTTSFPNTRCCVVIQLQKPRFFVTWYAMLKQ